MIDTKAIPAETQLNLAAVLASEAQKFFEDPENLQAFEEWKKGRENK